MVLRQGFLPALLFSHVGFIVVFIYMLLLAEGQMDEAWELCKEQCTFGNREALDGTLGCFRFASL
jgi:hypothetical protein